MKFPIFIQCYQILIGIGPNSWNEIPLYTFYVKANLETRHENDNI